jgi:hypothetical protein
MGMHPFVSVVLTSLVVVIPHLLMVEKFIEHR